MSKCQKVDYRGCFQENEIDIMKLRDNEVNFDVRHEINFDQYVIAIIKQ